MNMNRQSSFIFSILLHVSILLLLIGFNTTKVIYITPQSNEPTIIEANLVFSPTKSVKKFAPKPEIKPEVKPEVKPEIKPEIKPEPEPEPEIMSKNTVNIQSEKIPPQPDKKREEKLKKMAEQSFAQALKQENQEKIEKKREEDFQKKLQEHDREFQQSTSASEAVSDSELTQYMANISSKVTKNWRQPIDSNIKGLKCVVLIKTGSNGEVIEVSVIQGSGHLGFDRSAELAVRKSSPLPMPKNVLARTQFKVFEFSFHPEIS